MGHYLKSNIAEYAQLLGMSDRPDPKTYLRDFGKAGPRNAAGIPLAFEDQAERVAEVIASAYEERYDAIKAQMKRRDLQFSRVLVDEAGEPMAVNFAALAAAPIVSDVTDDQDLLPYCVVGLHWLLADPEKEWVFSHLAEATGAYFRFKDLREQLDPGYGDDFDDLRGLLREALRHFMHRDASQAGR